MDEEKTYTIFVPEDNLGKFEAQEEEVFRETLIDESTREQFEAKVMVSRSRKEGYERVRLQGRGGFLSGEWFVKIVEREDEDEDEVTVFESMKLGDRRGYMLRSMMAESDRSKSKKETMTTELEKRLKRKQELVAEILKKK